MADNKTHRGPADRDRINVHEAYEVDYWTEALAVSPDQLKDLVARHGPLALDIRAALKKRESGKTKSRPPSTGWKPNGMPVSRSV